MAWQDGAVRQWLEGDESQLLPLVEQLADAYPDCTMHVGDATRETPRCDCVANLRLVPDLFPLRTYTEFEDQLNRNLADPMAGLLSTLRAIGTQGLDPAIRIRLTPVKLRQIRCNQRVIERLDRGFRHRWLTERFAILATSSSSSPRLLAAVSATLLPPGKRRSDTDQARKKSASHLFETRICLEASGDVASSSVTLQQLAGCFGRFTSPRATFRRQRQSRLGSGRGGLLASEEIVTLWHPPVATVRVEKLQPSSFRELEPPLHLPDPSTDPSCAILSRRLFRARHEPFGMSLDDRRRHLAIVGKTGMGKSTLMERLVVSDIENGHGVALIDPHGDLAEHVISIVPRQRTNDVILFDAGDRSSPVAFNPLDCRRDEDRSLVASGVLSAFKKLYSESWGPRMEHIWRHALLAALEQPGCTLETVSDLLAAKRTRQRIVERVTDPVVRRFWLEKFAAWKPQLQAEAVLPIQNKLGQFLAHPILRDILINPRSKLRLRNAMDGGHVLIVNLSKGRIGDDASTLLGSLLVTQLQLAAMSRAEQAEADRRDFFVYVDEFQNFATESFATILSESRKYRLSLVLANQHLSQMDDSTRGAVFGNVGNLLCFQVGADDAETLADQLGGDATPRDLMNLPKYIAYLRLLVDGMPSRPFSIETLHPQPVTRPQQAETIRQTSRHRYSSWPRHGSTDDARRLGA